MNRVLFLGYKDCRILSFLKKQKGWSVFSTEDKISTAVLEDIDPHLVVSYGYKTIIPKDVISQIKDKAVNLHISYLPWNRGIYPNLWSILENTPKGVSIHMLDAGIDTGDLLYQKRVSFGNKETLSSSYEILQEEIQDLFIENWESIAKINFRNIRKKQNKTIGSFHLRKEGDQVLKDLQIDNWEISVSEVKSKQDVQIINEIQAIRAKNNTHWMDVVKLAFEIAPEEARDIFKKIKHCDFQINELLKELAEND